MVTTGKNKDTSIPISFGGLSGTPNAQPIAGSWHREEFWAEKVRAYIDSGLPVEVFCRLNKLPSFQLHYWQRKLAT